MQDYIEDPGLKYRCDQTDKIESKIKALQDKKALQDQEFQVKLSSLLEELHTKRAAERQEMPAAIRKATSKLKAANNKLAWELKQAQKAAPAVVAQKEEKVGLERAKTLAIFDSILFSIENWATDDSPAPDFTLAAQATLFPLVYEEVGKGNSDYYITEVPTAAGEIVRRGREYIHAFRKEDDTSILQEESWGVISAEIHDWWVRDALPLLYGARDPDWEINEPYGLEDMLKWRHMEASRPLEFPLIFDGMELVKQFGDDIRSSTGLPEFSKLMITTRIQAHD
jgi:hypothetical protein